MKKIIYSLLGFFLFTALTACASQKEVQTTQLTLIHGWGGTFHSHSIMQEIYDKFDLENENIVLNSQPSSDSSIAVEKANDMLALDEMPNIVSTNGQSYYVENAKKRNKALDLMPYIEADAQLKSEIHPSVLEVWQNEDGTLYTVPDALEVMGYWYNASYFVEAGIVDESGEPDIPESWDEFYRVCEQLEEWNKTSGKLKGVYALENAQVVENLLLARLAGESQEGLDMVRDLPSSYNTEVFRNVIRDFKNIFRFSYTTDSIDNARQYFIDGSTAMYFNGVWESESIQNSERALDIAYANYPTNYGKALSYVSPSSGYVVYNSANEMENQAAIQFLKYMLSEEVQTQLATETGQAPSNPNVDNGLIIEKYPVLGKALETAHTAQIQIKTITSVWNSEVIDVISMNIKIASENEDELNNMIQKLDRSIK